MAIYAFDIAATAEYSLKADVGDDKTTFLIGCLDSQLDTCLRDEQTTFTMNRNGASAPADVSVKQNLLKWNLVRFGVKGWRNFKDKSGTEIAFDTAIVPLAIGKRAALTVNLMDKLKPYIAELADEVEKFNRFSLEEQKTF